MGIIISNYKNRRDCEKCNAGYVVNGDESNYWCEFSWKSLGFDSIRTEGLCGFCKNYEK